MRKNLLVMALLSLPLLASAQYTFDALQLSQTELRGTSRFTSMAGAFGALGGDLSTINQNPAGVGVYRSNDVSITLGPEFNGTKTANDSRQSETKFNVNNVGFVGSTKLNNDVLLNLNWGFSYNRINSFNRRYRGVASAIPTSITNYIADQTMFDGMTSADLDPVSGNPFYDGDARWNQILAYRSYLILPTSDINNYTQSFTGLGVDGTYGAAEFEVQEWGHTDEYSFALGGNIANTMYWGMALGVTELSYEYNKYYGESLTNTVVYDAADDPDAQLVDGNADFGIVDWSRTTGTGVNFKLGVILKPVNELRLGFAFHTPTLYEMKDTYQSVVRASFSGDNLIDGGYQLADEYTPDYQSNWYDIRTPWRFIGSIAGVIGSKGIISADYEYTGNGTIRICDENNNEYLDATTEIKDYLQPSHTVRLGAEYRVSPDVSLRAGYSYQTSPVKDDVKDDKVAVNVTGCNTAYTYDRDIQHITAGVGYHHKNFYCDLAYVYQARNMTYTAFPIDDLGKTVKWDVDADNHRLSATLGFRF